MYRIYDYIYNGWVLVNNMMRKQHKELTSLMIYSTTSCQSRCKHCAIWKKPIEHLNLSDIIIRQFGIRKFPKKLVIIAIYICKLLIFNHKVTK